MLDATAIVGEITTGTGAYLVEYAPLFLFAGGFVLALGVITWLISLLMGRKNDFFDE
jgi:hypothetical protein